MTLLGIFGLLLGLLTFRFAIIARTRTRITVFALAYLMHVLVTVFFYNYALTNITDSGGYYFDPYGFRDQGFGLATQLIYWFVHVGRETVGGTFLDYFLLFQAFGFAGLALLMRIIEEIYATLEVKQPVFSYGLLFLPGLQFWTSPLSKDGILFTAVCMTLWAAMEVRRRYLVMMLGIALMMLIRPHIALIAAAAAALTLVLDRTSSLMTKVLVVLIAAAGLVLAVVTMSTSFSVDVTDVESVDTFLATFEQTSQGVDAGTTAVQGGFLVKLLSLLFRPLFFDASGALGYIASLDNLFLLAVILFMAFNFRGVAGLVRSIAFLRFALVISAGIALALTVIYYNVGLGLRQKTMFVPGLLVIFITLLAVKRARRQTLINRDRIPAAELNPDTSAADHG